MKSLTALCFVLLPSLVLSFLPLWSQSTTHRAITEHVIGKERRPRSHNSNNNNNVLCVGGGRASSVTIVPELSDEKTSDLFAWISQAFSGEDPEYGNLMLCFAAVFGNLPEDSVPMEMLARARSLCPGEEELVGEAFTTDERELASLGAMGAGQWTGAYTTRPHSLLSIENITCVDDWVGTLPRGCKRTLKRALAQNFTVTGKPIAGGQPAPHSSLAHFRCVAEHEVRLITSKGSDPYRFLDALSEATSRYMGTTRMTGEIREYRNATTGRVIAVAHEVRKGRTIRGQWFYATDLAARNYVWFHSVHDLVRRAIESDNIDVVDLGPSGSDAFTDLKQKYGFVSVDDWPRVADYDGPFWYNDEQQPKGKGMASIRELQMKARGFFF